jgi:hypothetical protein
MAGGDMFADEPSLSDDMPRLTPFGSSAPPSSRRFRYDRTPPFHPILAFRPPYHAMNQLIYVETSIPSFYFETRPGAQMQARREWTREWWSIAKWSDALFTSSVVITELESTPDDSKRSDMVGLLDSIPRLPYGDAIDAIVEVYLKNKIMPLESGGDAHHLALASFHRCDMLATWNCKHIANPNKITHIRLVNASLGLATPQLLTPFELLESTP